MKILPRIVVISANLGKFSPTPQNHVDQNMIVHSIYLDDSNFPPRTKALHPRLQAKIPKMFGSDFAAGYDYIIWCDSTLTFTSVETVWWLLNGIGAADIAFFAHHDGRTSIRQELEFMQQYDRDSYLEDRYDTEPLEQQVSTYLADPTFVDDKLFSAGLFIYKNKAPVRAMLSDWFTQNARWSVQDQLSLPYVLSKHPNIHYHVLPGNLLDNEYVSHHFINKTNPVSENSNSHKWDNLYKNISENDEPSSLIYGDTLTYKMGAEFLSDCQPVEDWGTGAGGFKRFRPNAIGVDGSNTPYADKIEDLENYRTYCEGIFIRHVLEHNFNWETILENALASMTKKLFLCIFTPMSSKESFEIKEGSAENKAYGIDVPNLSLSGSSILRLIMKYGCTVDIQKFQTATAYGEETVFLIVKNRK
jgi:hypothetical protein